MVVMKMTGPPVSLTGLRAKSMFTIRPPPFR